MQSMTGFGTAKGRTRRSDVEVTLRSVNGRFFEWKASLPHRLLSLEPQLKTLTKKQFERGTLTVVVNERFRASDSEEGPQINIKRAKEWYGALLEMKKTLKLKGDIALDHLLRGSDLFIESEPNELSPADQTHIVSAFKKALENCQSERIREGQALKADLQKHLQILLKLAQRLESYRESANQHLKTHFMAKLKKLGLESLDSERLNAEIVLLIEKSDISEEISRLSTHLHRFSEILNAKASQGKKLDFYVQELLREVNTIGSKSLVPDMTETVVEMKTEIERLREQVQNIE